MASPGQVITLPRPESQRERRQPRRGGAGFAVAVLAAALVLSAFVHGLYAFAWWGALAAVMFAAAVALALSGHVRPTAGGWTIVAGLVGLAVLSATSMLWADSPDRAWTEANRIALYAATFVVGCGLLQTPGRRRILILVSAPLGAAISVVVLVRVLAGDDGAFVQHRLDAPLEYVNGTAGLLLMGVWPLVALAEQRGRSALAGAAAAGVVLSGNLLVLTQSRAAMPALLGSCVLLVALVPGRTARAWLLIISAAAVAAALPWTLEVFASRGADPASVPDAGVMRAAGAAAGVSALLAGVAWAIVAELSSRPRAQRLRPVAAGAAAAVVFAALAGGVVATGDPVDKVRQQWDRFAADELDQTSTVRFVDAGGFRHDLWLVAWRQFKEHPAGGVGAGSYGITYFRMRDNPESVRQPHSLQLQMLAELGVGGAVGLSAVLVGLAIAFARTRSAEPFVAVASGGLLLVWLLQTSVDWLWNLPALTCLAFLHAAALAARRNPASARPAPWGRVGGVVAIALVAVAAASLGRQYAADRYREAASADLARDPAGALRHSRRALELNDLAMETYYLRAAAFARFGGGAEAERTLRAAIDVEPDNFVPWALLGDLRVRMGRMPEAKAAYAEAQRRNPADAGIAALADDPDGGGP